MSELDALTDLRKRDEEEAQRRLADRVAALERARAVRSDAAEALRTSRARPPIRTQVRRGHDLQRTAARREARRVDERRLAAELQAADRALVSAERAVQEARRSLAEAAARTKVVERHVERTAARARQKKERAEEIAAEDRQRERAERCT